MADSSSYSHTGAASLLVLAVAFTGLFLGVENWWVAFVVGYGAVVPLVAMLTGEGEEENEEHGEDDTTTSVDQESESSSKQDAMETLRDRYARGELSEAQFERKLERLLETETLEDARETVDRTGRDLPTESGTSETSRERDVEYE